MNKATTITKNITPVLVPLALLATLIVVTTSLAPLNIDSIVEFAVTADLIITIPLVYYLLIRKRNVPKTTVVPFIIIGLVTGSLILPENNQFYLDLFKTYALPILEITILVYIIIKVRTVLKSYKKQKKQSPDFYTAINEAATSILPGFAARLFAAEISTLYYGFIYWKKKIPADNEFTYHKKSSIITTLLIFIFLIAIETAFFHYLLSMWSSIAAWILTILSIYTAIQIFGIVRSMTKRFISFDGDNLILRYGILNEAIININNIRDIEISSKKLEFNEETKSLSPFKDFDKHNVVIRLINENNLNGMYGIKSTCKTLVLHVDEPEKFRDSLLNKS